MTGIPVTQVPSGVAAAWLALAVAEPATVEARLVMAEAVATLVEVDPPYPPMLEPVGPRVAEHEALAIAREALHAGIRASGSVEERLRLARTLRVLRALPA